MIDGATRVCGVVGDPVRHSLSPTIHNAGYRAAGLNRVYVALPVEKHRFRKALTGAIAMDFDGLSVTMPHKINAAQAADELDSDAAALGVVNALAIRDGKTYGANTDGTGLVDALAAVHNWSPEGQICGVIGAGGAARSVIRALAAAGADRVLVHGRTPTKTASAVLLAGRAGAVAQPDDIAKCDLVINATPVGMAEVEPGVLPPGGAEVCENQVVADLVYHPLNTPLLRLAKVRGARTVNGVEVLVHISARAYELFVGDAAPVDAMKEAALAAVSGNEGQPGAELGPS